jgi:hypothetical protein
MDGQGRDIEAELSDVVTFAEKTSGRLLRGYQQVVARRIVDSVLQGRGDSLVVIYPRQSGKNEVQAQVEAFLLARLSPYDADMVKASPTWKPQSQLAMHRLERVLERNKATCNRWKKEAGYIYRFRRARLTFLSGQPETNVVGATANTLLQCDEAQDVRISKWDKDFAPMAASTNATRVFWGTAWTSKTLLARELRAAQQAERQDDRRRVFIIDAQDVAAEVPAYGEFVAQQVAKLGRNHPMVRTQYYSEEIDSQGGMFPPQRRGLMKGDHPRVFEPRRDGFYALLVDVAGQAESGSLQLELFADPGRDSTALTVVEVDLSTLEDEMLQAPTYRVVDRRAWVGTKHAALYGQLKGLAEHWNVVYVVIDATGVGEGLASFLERALPGKVIPFKFTAKSKSDLGWAFLSVVETGRFKDHLTNGYEQADFWLQLEHVQYEAKGNHGLRWSVPEGTRDPATGTPVHDDWVLSAALCALLDQQEWGLAESEIINAYDPLEGMAEAY